VVGSCKYGDEPAGSGATELVTSLFDKNSVFFSLSVIFHKTLYLCQEIVTHAELRR
jgi:hypothetical protein